MGFPGGGSSPTKDGAKKKHSKASKTEEAEVKTLVATSVSASTRVLMRYFNVDIPAQDILNIAALPWRDDMLADSLPLTATEADTMTEREKMVPDMKATLTLWANLLCCIQGWTLIAPPGISIVLVSY